MISSPQSQGLTYTQDQFIQVVYSIQTQWKGQGATLSFKNQIYKPMISWCNVLTFDPAVNQEVAVRGSENKLPAEGLGPQGPWLSSPAEWEKKCCYSQRNWGAIYCSLSSLQLTSHTQPFRIKCEVYFSKEVCSFCHYCWLCFHMYT